MGLMFITFFIGIIPTYFCCDCQNATCILPQIPPQGGGIHAKGKFLVGSSGEYPSYVNIFQKHGDPEIEEITEPGTNLNLGCGSDIWLAYHEQGDAGQTVDIVEISVDDYGKLPPIRGNNTWTQPCAIKPGGQIWSGFDRCRDGLTMFSSTDKFGRLTCEITKGCPVKTHLLSGSVYAIKGSGQPGIGIYYAGTILAEDPQWLPKCQTQLGYIGESGNVPWVVSPLEGCEGLELTYMPMVPLIKGTTVWVENLDGAEIVSDGTIFNYKIDESSNNFDDFVKCCGFLLGPGGAVAQWYANHQGQGGGGADEVNKRLNDLINKINYNQDLTNKAITDLRTKVARLEVDVAANTARIYLIEQYTNSTDYVEQRVVALEERKLRLEGWCETNTPHCWCPPEAPILPTHIPTNPPLPEHKDYLIYGLVVVVSLLVIGLIIFCICKGSSPGQCLPMCCL